MNRHFIKRVVAASLFAIFGLLTSGDLSLNSDRLVSGAEARIVRPWTPMSYAGVARRTTRLAIAVGAVAGGVYASGTCARVVNAYGQVVRVCR